MHIKRDQVIFFLKRTRQVNLRVKTGVTSDGNLAHFEQIGGWESTSDVAFNSEFTDWCPSSWPR